MIKNLEVIELILNDFRYSKEGIISKNAQRNPF